MQFIELKERLPQGPMLTFFAIAVMLDLHTATDLVMRMITELLEVFPQSVHLLAQRALVYYHCRGTILRLDSANPQILLERNSGSMRSSE